MSKYLTFKIHDDDLSPFDTSDFYGEYTDQPAWGENRVIIDSQQGQNYRSNTYRYWQSWDLSNDETWYRDHGYAKHDAWLKPRQSARRAFNRIEDYGNGWCLVGFVVTLHDGVVNESESLWGIESDCGEEFALEILSELTTQHGLELPPEDLQDLFDEKILVLPQEKTTKEKLLALTFA